MHSRYPQGRCSASISTVAGSEVFRYVSTGTCKKAELLPTQIDGGGRLIDALRKKTMLAMFVKHPTAIDSLLPFFLPLSRLVRLPL